MCETLLILGTSGHGHTVADVAAQLVFAVKVILPKALVNTGVVVKRGCIINLGAIIDHGCVVEEGCHICIGAIVIVKGENQIPRLTKVEAGEVIEARTLPIIK